MYINGKKITSYVKVEYAAQPQGTKEITTNGTHDIKDYAYVTVNVPSTGGGGNTQLFAPTLTASDKTITIRDSKNGAFVESYILYKNNNYISEIESSLNISSYLNKEEDTQTFNVKAKGLLLDSEKSNNVNYYRVLFKNQNDILLGTQIQLENETFKYNGTEPIYEGNFYGWNTEKTAQTREPILISTKPLTYYAIYTSEFGDTIVNVGTYSSMYLSDKTRKMYAVEIDNIAYVLVNNLVYKFDPTSEEKTPIEIGTFTSAVSCANGKKIYSFNANNVYKTYILHVFDTETCQQEEDITLTFSEYSFDPNMFIVKDDYVYLLANTGNKNSYGQAIQKLIKYDLTTHTYTIVAEIEDDKFKEMKIFSSDIYLKGIQSIWWYNINTNNVQKVCSNSDYHYGCISMLNGKMYSYDQNGRMLEFDVGTSTISSPTNMTAILDIGTDYLSYQMACVTIGKAIYFFGNNKIQKYY